MVMHNMLEEIEIIKDSGLLKYFYSSFITLERIDLLEKYEINANEFISNQTPLEIALFNGALKSAEWLFTKGADLLSCNEFGYNLLHISIMDRRFDLRRPEMIDIRTPSVTPLILAIEFQDFNIFNLLLKNGADVNGKDLQGSSVAHVAVEENDAQFILALLEGNVDMDVLDADGRTPLLTAIWLDNSITTAAILSRRPDLVNTVDAFGESVLNYIEYHTSPMIVQYIDAAYFLLNRPSITSIN
ncbi:ankyrin [Rozella allomycis CSF55]|uniref:Ankyrin n=1 Tax=Rozella allomycis (strain CSF55) TaxID=988480 RepID=A0A075AWY2_ROZAC|nr:hypothetical protein O9G_001186 [Rozella allomycis CSF55]RKP17159.1 ankyrin [Rozella allomycis CSF55]|eukprot:EPZ33217.1 hypothetical protein O9G_001186 [Rozella allomycis CSF55]